MRFDQESLQPLFKLDIGPPGSSFTFEVAHINGINNDLIKRAKGKLDHRKVKLDELISELQKEKNTLAKVTDRHLKKELELEQLKVTMNRREQHINDRAEAQQALAEDNNDALHRGRKLQQFIDKFDPGSRNKALLQDVEKYLAVEKTKRLENQAAKQAKKRAQSAKASKRRPKHFVERIQVGSTVRLRNGGKERGEVIAMHKNAATVLFGAFKSKIELEKLSWVANYRSLFDDELTRGRRPASGLHRDVIQALRPPAHIGSGDGHLPDIKLGNWAPKGVVKAQFSGLFLTGPVHVHAVPYRVRSNGPFVLNQPLLLHFDHAADGLLGTWHFQIGHIAAFQHFLACSKWIEEIVKFLFIRNGIVAVPVVAHLPIVIWSIR